MKKMFLNDAAVQCCSWNEMQCIILSRINPCSPIETQTFHSRIIGKVVSPWRTNQMVFQIKTILGEKKPTTLEIK